MDRRQFLQASLFAAQTPDLHGVSFEERALLAQAQKTGVNVAAEPGLTMPKGKIRDIEISRLICGGNLISGHAHSRDLIYVSSLLKHYFTDDKVMETLRLCEGQGINTAILRLDDDTLRILNRYWNQEGGKLQWIAQVKPTVQDIRTDCVRALDHGATGVYVQGQVGDKFVAENRVDLLGKTIAIIQDAGAIAGIGGHSIKVPIACEAAGIPCDFYMKTFNAKRYWSAAIAPEHDNLWEETPEETAAFMANVKKPWIAFKVMAAGAIPPREGFEYAYVNGADFICAGMFDFQVAEDAGIAREVLAGPAQKRTRPWMG